MKKSLLTIVFTILIVLGWSRVLDRGETLPAAPETAPAASRLAELLGSQDPGAYELATSLRAFEFPADHGPHPGFRNEWWYLTGNLDSRDGRRFGFELTFFRFSLSPHQPESTSSWRTRQVYIAHLALSDVADRRFYVAQRYSRGAAGLAGARAEPFRVWIDDWNVRQDPADAADGPEEWLLDAQTAEFALGLELSAEKRPVLNGRDGLSQKSAAAGNASYYYSISRLGTSGSLRVGDTTYEVVGLSWLDREWSSSALSEAQSGWDWFALQLSDGADLMFYNIRRIDGSQDEHSAGTWIDRDGRYRPLDRAEVTLEVLGEWQSPRGGTYPAAWQLEIPAMDLSLEVRPVMEDQELVTTVRYWEGAVDVSGSRGGTPIEGRGYVELTGYAH